jgi:hypothetical protein
MTHLNVILEGAARDFISDFIQRTRYRFTYDPQTLVPGIEDTDEPYDLEVYDTVEYFLNEAAGPQHGIQSLGHVLHGLLLGVAAEHVKKPRKAAEVFLVDLKRRPLVPFLSDGKEHDVKQRVASLRRHLNKFEYRLEKSRRRDPLHSNYDVYNVIHRATGEVNVDAPRDLDRLEQWAETLSTASPDAYAATAACPPS